MKKVIQGLVIESEHTNNATYSVTYGNVINNKGDNLSEILLNEFESKEVNVTLILEVANERVKKEIQGLVIESENTDNATYNITYGNVINNKGDNLSETLLNEFEGYEIEVNIETLSEK